jgi:hypothetical protein
MQQPAQTGAAFCITKKYNKLANIESNLLINGLQLNE